MTRRHRGEWRTPPADDRIRAIESACYVVVKRHGRWWVINPHGLARPCASQRIAMSLVPKE